MDVIVFIFILHLYCFNSPIITLFHFCLAYGQGETMRGCFNSVIASLILADDNLQEGCHEIPRKFGTGQICVCDSNLCNSATSLRMGLIPSKFSIFGTVKHDFLNRLYFAGFIFIVFMQRIILTQSEWVI